MEYLVIGFVLSVGWHIGDYVVYRTIKFVEGFVRELKRTKNVSTSVKSIFTKTKPRTNNKIKIGFQYE